MACVYIPDRLLGFIKILIIWFFFSCIMTLVTLVFSRQAIIDNWNEYKCNPLVTPFAGFFGKDATTSSNECSSSLFMGQSFDLMGPTLDIFGDLSDTLDGLSDIMNDLTHGTSGFASMFGKGLRGFLQQLSNVGSTFQYLVIKMQTLLSRIVATMATVMYTLMSLFQGMLGIQSSGLVNDVLNTITKM